MVVLPFPHCLSSLPFCNHKRHKFNTKTIQCCEYLKESRKMPSHNGNSRFPEKNPHMIPAPRPRRIILVRHGQSEGNVDESVYTRVADPKIGLTEIGMSQAEECGRRIRDLIQKDGSQNWKLYFYVSPYRRTLETLKSLARPFERSRIAGIREEPRLREQDFGNFQNREKMRVEKAIRNLYGRFFYRFPDGESAADVYDRITGNVINPNILCIDSQSQLLDETGFRETLRTDINIGRFQPPGDEKTEMNLVIVSHGLTLRVFLMRWYKWTVQQFEGLHNLGNGNMVVMEKGYGGRYSLLMHHDEEELRRFGLTDEMLIDQEWQKCARPADLNYDCPMINSFFPHLNNEETCRG